MTTSRKRTKQAVPLIVEPHPTGYTGYPFITLIQYKHEQLLCLIDNHTDKQIKSFVLDFCGPAGVNEENIIKVANHWFNNNFTKYPLSIEFSKYDMTPLVDKIYRKLNVEFVTRVIGPLPSFNMDQDVTVRRRRKKPISDQVKANQKIIKIS